MAMAARVGVVVGLGTLVRGEALTWLLLPVVMWWRGWWRGDRSRKSWQSPPRTTAVVMVPWTIRNEVVMDAFVPVATNASETLWSGHNAGATGAQVYPPADYNDRFDQTLPALELQRAKALRSDAVHFIRSRRASPMPGSTSMTWQPTPGRLYIANGQMPPVGTANATVYCRTACTRPIDPVESRRARSSR